MNIPETIFNKIMLYNSHPIADIVKTNIETVTTSGRNNYGSSTYGDMYFNCMEHYLKECFDADPYYLSKTKRKWIRNGRYPYNLKHLTNEPVWNYTNQ